VCHKKFSLILPLKMNPDLAELWKACHTDHQKWIFRLVRTGMGLLFT
jgi:hypothetical protein